MKFRQIIFPLVLLLLMGYTLLCFLRTFDSGVAIALPATAAVFFLMVGSQIVTRAFHWPTHCLAVRCFVWAGSITMGLWTTYIFFTMALDLANLALLLIHLFSDSARLPDYETTQHLLHRGMLALLVAACVFAAIGLLQAVKGPNIRRVAVAVKNLPVGLAGLRIAQISDLHIGATIKRDYIEHIVSTTMALGADIIAITGDLADGKPEDLGDYAAPLANLKARLGVYFITGNHEYYSGALAWIDYLKTLGIPTLLNENRVLEYNGEKIMVAGVTDISAHYFIPSHRSSPEKAIASDMPSAFRLLLAHQPESCFEAEKAGFDLQLCGHTHAGQFFPFSVLVYLVKRYSHGLYRHGRMWIYVNAGTGYWGAANRFGVPSEITLLTLKGA